MRVLTHPDAHVAALSRATPGNRVQEAPPPYARRARDAARVAEYLEGAAPPRPAGAPSRPRNRVTD